MKIRKNFLALLTTITSFYLLLSSCGTVNTNSNNLFKNFLTKNNDKPSLSPSSQKTPFEKFQMGGEKLRTLKVDRYLSVINQISKINQSTFISELTDSKLNEELKNTKSFNKLNLKILDGSSEVTNTLKLKLSGEYLGKLIPDDATIIVTGFSSPNSQNLRLNKIELNKNLFFENLITKNNFSTFKNEKWKKYLSSTELTYELNNVQKFANNLDSDIVAKHFEFEFDYAENQIRIKAKNILNEFKNNKWCPILNKSDKFVGIRRSSISDDFSIPLPNKNEALNFFVKKIKLISDTNYLNNYASFYQGESYNQKLNDFKNVFFSLKEDYKNYILSQYSFRQLGIKNSGIAANDFKGELFLRFSLIDWDEENSRNPSYLSKFREEKITGFKKIAFLTNDSNFNAETLEKNEKDWSIVSKEFMVRLDTDEKVNRYWTRIKNLINKDYKNKKEKSENVTNFEYNNAEISQPLFSNAQDSIVIIKGLVDDLRNRENINREDFENTINKNTNYKLLKKIILNNFTFEDYLFNGPDGKFFIKSLRAKIQDNTKAKVKKIKNGYQYHFVFDYILEITNSSSPDDDHSTESYIIPGVISAEFAASDIEN